MSFTVSYLPTDHKSVSENIINRTRRFIRVNKLKNKIISITKQDNFQTNESVVIINTDCPVDEKLFAKYEKFLALESKKTNVKSVFKVTDFLYPETLQLIESFGGRTVGFNIHFNYTSDDDSELCKLLPKYNTRAADIEDDAEQVSQEE